MRKIAVRKIADQAIGITNSAERREFISKACGENTSLKHAVEQRVQNALTIGFVDGTPVADLENTSASNPAEIQGTQSTLNSPVAYKPGNSIGPYKLLQQIGEGGMGSVWSAEQLHPVKRTVALKIIKAGMDTEQVIARFEAERQALAIMNHPNIARVLDAGATDSGRPYFVMELVNGIPITDYCDKRRFSSEQRIQLFCDVCQAVQHAHQKGIIHRDIKPSNVLVTDREEKPVVKVIDFGLAKATSQKLTEKTLFTAIGQMVGTPVYMSPEQADRGGLDIDTRTDVYSLGVLLYELLTGATPISLDSLRNAGYADIQRLICEKEAPAMSSRISSLAGDSAEVAEKRSTDPRRLTQQLRGDLDVVVAKAMEKERSRRYSSPGDLADDLGRFLKNEPIEARPASAAYRFRKLARRNRGKFVAAALVFLALIGGLIGTALGLIEANRQAQVANTNLVTAEENYELARESVDRYLTQISENQLLDEPHMAGLRKELLLSASEFYENFVQRRQHDAAALVDLAAAQLRLSEIYWDTGETKKALATLRSARDSVTQARKETTKEFNSEIELLNLQTGLRLSEYLSTTGETDEPLTLLSETIEQAQLAEAQSSKKEFAEMAARSLRIRGDIYRKRNQMVESEKDILQAIEILEKTSRRVEDNQYRNPLLADCYGSLGLLHYTQANQNETTEWLEKAIELRRKVVRLYPESTQALRKLTESLSLLSQAYRRQNLMKEAVESALEARELGRSLVNMHPELPSLQSNLTSILSNLGNIYQVAGKPDRADEVNLEALKIMETMVQNYPDLPQFVGYLGVAQGNTGNVRLSRREWQKAIDWYDKSNSTLATILKKTPNDPRYRKVFRNNHWGRADAFVALEKFSEAQLAFDEAIEFTTDRFRPEVRMAKAMATAKSGDYEAAVAAVEKQTGDKSTDSMIYFDGARVLMVALAKLSTSGGLSEKEKAERKTEIAKMAVASLRHALEQGFLKKSDPKSPLLSKEFKPLEDNTDFHQLLQDAKLDIN